MGAGCRIGHTPVLVIGAVCLALWLTFGRGRSIRPLLLYLVGFGAFVQLRALADETGITVHYAYVIDLETALFGVVPSAWLQAHLYEPARATLIDIFAAVVYVSYYFIFHILALLLWLRHRDRFPFYAGAVLLTYYLGLAVSFLLPTAPPWLAAEAGEIPTTMRIFRDFVTTASDGSYEAGLQVASVNDVAAMPSLHMAITVIVAIAAWWLHRLAGILAFLYAGSMAFALVYLGEHYLVDIVAGVLTAGLAWMLAARFSALRRAPIAATDAGPRRAGGAAAETGRLSHLTFLCLARLWSPAVTRHARRPFANK